MTQENIPELSLPERMYLMMGPLQTAIYGSIFGSLACIVCAVFLYDALGLLAEFYRAGGINPEMVEWFHEIIGQLGIFVFTIIGCASATIIWYVVRMRPVQKKLDNLRREFTKENYFLTLGLTSHKEDVVMDIFEAMFDIFPELKNMEIRSLKQTGYTLDMHQMEIADRKGGKYVFDTCEETKHGYFLIKDFSDKIVDFTDVKECTKLAKNNFTKRGNPFVMRLICLMKKFDDNVIAEYEKLFKDKENPPVDLILVTENGYTPLKISERVVDR